jgi:hypothetical protein
MSEKITKEEYDTQLAAKLRTLALVSRLLDNLEKELEDLYEAALSSGLEVGLDEGTD